MSEKEDPKDGTTDEHRLTPIEEDDLSCRPFYPYPSVFICGKNLRRKQAIRGFAAQRIAEKLQRRL